MSARFRRTPIALAALASVGWAALALPAPAAAQRRLGEEFRVNSYTPGAQHSAAMASHADGSFVVVWTSYAQDGSAEGVFGRRYDADGNAVGGEFQVNTYTTESQWGASVATDGDGDFVVVWSSEGQEWGIFGQRYDASGDPVGGEFPVGEGANHHRSVRDVAMDADGSFVVAWDRGNLWQSGAVFARRFDASATPLGDEFLVSTASTWNLHHQPAIAVAEGGDFVVTWTSGYGFPSYCCHEVLGQRYDATGTPLGDTFEVVWQSWYQGQSDVTMDSQGEFVVVWASFFVCPFDDEDCVPSGRSAGYGIIGQRFNAEGERVGAEFQVADEQFQYNWWPKVAHLTDDEFVVVWQDKYSVGYDIFGHVVNDLGALLGTEFLVNTYAIGNQKYASVAGGANDDFLVVWGGPGSSDTSGVFGQRFAGPGPALTVDGSCPGPVTVTVSSAPPSSEVAVVAAANANGFVKGGALCPGTRFAIGEPFQLPPSFVIVDLIGTGSTNMNLAPDRCHVQALAFATCETSNVVEVP
jgi:hypothetical protein